MAGFRSDANAIVAVVAGVDQLTIKNTGVVTTGAPGVSGNDVCVMGQSKLTTATAQATTSGTAIDFTGVPSWAKRITVVLNGVSTSGTSQPIIQLGSGSVQTSGYLGSSMDSVGGGVSFTGGFNIYTGVAARLLYGTMTLTHMGGNTWVAAGLVGANAAVLFTTAGVLPLSGVLDRVRLTTNGADTFDAGSVNILWE